MIIRDINEWIKATHVPSMEFCGEEVDPEKTILDFVDKIGSAKLIQIIEWTHVNRPVIVCVDGFSFSCQGHQGSYSYPKHNSDYYDRMEIGFPSHFDDSEFYNNDGDVCGYVEVSDIQKVIIRHGGIDTDKSFLNWNYKGTQKYKREDKLKRLLK